MLKVKNLKKKFDDVNVLKGISFDVNDRDIVAIVGPSGSGKSTLLRCLNLIEVPTSALDPEMVGEVLDLIKDVAATGKTMIIVSHEMNFVKNVSTRVLFLDEGKLEFNGSTKEFFKNKNDRINSFLAKVNK